VRAEDIAGCNAVVTGAAGGIGLGICRALAGAGANIALLDIAGPQLLAARDEIAQLGGGAHAFAVDVSDGRAMELVAESVAETVGNVHILVNNAGVTTGPTPVSQLTRAEWDWMLGVNLYGVIHGLAAFLPGMRGHGQPGYIVNTASIGGMQVRKGRDTGGYAASKFAIVALSEALDHELEGTPLGVAVLCPAATSTGIYLSTRRRPDRFGGPAEPPHDNVHHDELHATGVHPDVIGRRLLAAMHEGEFFVFTHDATRAWLDERHERIRAAYDDLERYNAAQRG
jgi:NAD(P)-dependent dehydrogenase (short-subunit alcohol dehydrogenase family)